MKKKVIKSEKAPEAVGPYSQAIRAGNLLFISGGYFGEDPPARACIEAANLPKGVGVEVVAIAACGD